MNQSRIATTANAIDWAEPQAHTDFFHAALAVWLEHLNTTT